MSSTSFDPACRACPRLSKHLAEVKRNFPDYHAAPVPAFGVKKPKLLIVGLAPGMHGANATGRPFTGDYAGILLYETLYAFGFSNKPQSVSASDGLRLKQCRITNAVKCLPPANKPVGEEINTCNRFLRQELAELPYAANILALGSIAHQAVLKSLGLKQKDFAFGHGKRHTLPEGLTLFDSYHCSRYNTQTKRLTEAGFKQVFKRIRQRIDNG